MASGITIDNGAQSVSVIFNNVDDAKVQVTLLRYYEIRGLGPDTASPADKVRAVMRDWARHTMKTVNRYEVDARQAAVLDEIAAEYGLGDE